MPSRELQVVAAVLAGSTPATLTAPLVDQRAAYDAVAAVYPPEAGTVVEELDAGGVAAELVAAPGARRDALLLHLHGGGFGIGSPAGYRGTAARLSAATGVAVVVPAYRLAPEHPFPAALEDACSAYRWVIARAAGPGRVALSGDSAGGGLALSTLVAARDAGEPMPAATTLWSPWVDLAGSQGASGDPSGDEGVRDAVISAAWLRERAAAYAGDRDPTDPLVSPLRADLRGLPPMLVLVGTDELLRSQARRTVEVSRAAGIDVALDETEGGIHLWMHLVPQAAESQAAFERAGRFLADRLAPSATA